MIRVGSAINTYYKKCYLKAIRSFQSIICNMKKLTKYDIRVSTLFSYSLYGLVKIIHPTCEWFRRCLRFLSGKPCGTKCLWRNNNLRLFSWWHAILALEALPVKSTTHQAMFTRSDNKRVECFQQKNTHLMPRLLLCQCLRITNSMSKGNMWPARNWIQFDSIYPGTVCQVMTVIRFGLP